MDYLQQDIGSGIFIHVGAGGGDLWFVSSWDVSI